MHRLPHRPLPTRVLGALALTASLGAMAACQQVSSLHDLTTDPARLTGTATPGTAVFLLAGAAAAGPAPATPGPRFVLADARGRFELPGLVPGRTQLLLNDLAGRGALLDTVLVGGVPTDLGSIDLAPLESLPGILDLAHVGFEERVSRDRGDHGEPRYTADGSRVYTQRTLPGETTLDIVETLTATGEVRVLVEGERPGGYLGYDRVVPQLFEDRYYVYGARRTDESVNGSHEAFVGLDVLADPPAPIEFPVHSGTGYVRGPDEYQSDYQDSVPFHIGGGRMAYFIFVGGSEPNLGDPDASRSPVLELCVLSLADGGSRRCLRMPERPASFNFVGSRMTLLLQGAVHQVDLDAPELELRLIQHPVGSVYAVHTSPGGLAMAVYHPMVGSVLLRGDLEGEELVPVAQAPDGMAIRTIIVDDALDRALLGVGQPDPELPPGGYSTRGQGAALSHRVSLRPPPGQGAPLEPLPTEATVGDRTLELRHLCHYDLTADRAVAAERAGGNKSCFGTGDTLLAEALPEGDACQALIGSECSYARPLVLEVDPETSAATVVPPYLPLVSASGRQARLERDAESGYVQVQLDRRGAAADPATVPADPAAFQVSTFVSADHADLAWTGDGGTLLYFTRDPDRGYVGLFRLDVAQLEALTP